MECICALTRPWFILSYEGVWGGMELEPTLTPRDKFTLPQKFSPEEDGTHDASSSRRQQSKHITSELFRPCMNFCILCVCLCECVSLCLEVDVGVKAAKVCSWMLFSSV